MPIKWVVNPILNPVAIRLHLGYELEYREPILKEVQRIFGPDVEVTGGYTELTAFKNAGDTKWTLIRHGLPERELIEAAETVARLRIIPQPKLTIIGLRIRQEDG